MPTITITLTETQYKGLEYAALDPKEWAENAIIERCRMANDKIVQLTVDYCLNNNISIPTTREDIVAYAFENGLVKTVAQQNAESAAKIAQEIDTASV